MKRQVLLQVYEAAAKEYAKSEQKAGGPGAVTGEVSGEKHGEAHGKRVKLCGKAMENRWKTHEPLEHDMEIYGWLVVWNIFYFCIYWEQSSQLTNIFQRGSNHQPENIDGNIWNNIWKTKIWDKNAAVALLHSAVDMSFTHMACKYTSNGT